MKTDTPSRVHRSDYRPPAFSIVRADLTFELGEEETHVTAELEVRRNDGTPADEPLELVGEALTLEHVELDGRTLAPGAYVASPNGLTVHGVPDRFRLTTRVAIRPQENTALSGLYKSSGTFCTQCEAEGFRRITYFLDRPDVMARYSTTIYAEAERYPVLLSNGNRVASGALDDGRHWVRWEDPFPKPSYLFALVAGRLACHEGTFRTASGRDVRLEIWVEPANIDRCDHALESLARAMRWDEERFGLEYDLDVYMIVAVGDFNMGAMENKGLNVFNAKYVLARPDTATDDDYEAVEAVIAHEYFHNWTGNRVTCRDWFQLTLKEGLTVFRDQLYSADVTSPPVRRIAEVNTLRIAQYAEDAGPMAHPIRPESYVSMDNFYTVTVYNKGAEVVRLYHTLLGEDGFRRGMDLYFERHDGAAVTCDDFRHAMADANGRDLAQMERWYDQRGTPCLRVACRHDPEQRTFELTLAQSGPDQAGGRPFQPTVIPVRMALLDPRGAPLPLRLAGEVGGTVPAPTERVLEVTAAEQRFVFTGIAERPVPSLLRDFSAPVRLSFERSRDDLAFLMAHDGNPFNRWDAGQTLAEILLLDGARGLCAGETFTLDPRFVDAWGRVLEDAALDGSLKAQALVLPAEKLLGQSMEPVDPERVFEAREQARRTLGEAHRERLWATLEATAAVSDSGSREPEAVAARRLKNVCLAYLSAIGDERAIARAAHQAEHGQGMTDVQAALTVLAALDRPERQTALERFYERWRGDPLVLDKWFSVQATSNLATTPERVIELSRHRDFQRLNPNRVRSLVGAFSAANQRGFHRADGIGYDFLTDQVLAVDPLNPQIAAHLVSAFNPWRRFEPGRQRLMRASLERILATDGLSKDVTEIVTQALGRPT